MPEWFNTKSKWLTDLILISQTFAFEQLNNTLTFNNSDMLLVQHLPFKSCQKNLQVTFFIF